MQFKQLAVAAATAALFVSGVHAQSSDRFDFVEELVEEVLDDPFENYYDGGVGGVGGVGESVELDAAVLSAAINVEDINGSVSITGRDVTLSTGAAGVSATATATAADSVAKATAIVGTDITTLAAGAINSSNVEVAGYQLGEDGIDPVDDYSFSGYEIDVPYTAVFQGAINVAAIDASVTIAATAASGIYHTTGGALSLSNLAISTTALGAVNSGTVRIGADLIEAAKLPATVAAP